MHWPLQSYIAGLPLGRNFPDGKVGWLTVMVDLHLRWNHYQHHWKDVFSWTSDSSLGRASQSEKNTQYIQPHLCIQFHHVHEIIWKTLIGVIASCPFFFFFCPYPWHVEIPRLGIKSKPWQWPEPQQWRCQILNPTEPRRNSHHILSLVTF